MSIDQSAIDRHIARGVREGWAKPQQSAGKPSQAAPTKPNKYHAQRTTVDGITFASKREAAYIRLTMETKATPGMWFLMQVPFRLTGGVVYRADFVVFRPSAFTVNTFIVSVIDAKGYKTQTYINKRKQVKELYGIEIEEV